MKEFLELFIYKPKRTEKIVTVLLKLLFALCFTIWAYERIGVPDITAQLTELEKLKLFILKGHVILFLFGFYILYQLFFNFSSYAFSAIGLVSYWLMYLVYFITSNTLNFLLAIIAYLCRKGWKFKITFQLTIDQGFFSFSHKIFRHLMVKGKLIKSKEQRIRSSKELNKLMKVAKVVLIEHGSIVYKKIHTMFMFSFLFFVFYFFYLKNISHLIPEVNLIVFWLCLIICSIQIIAYWMYNNFRLLYYFYLLLYRGFHKEDLEREMKAFTDQIIADFISGIEVIQSEESSDSKNNPEEKTTDEDKTN